MGLLRFLLAVSVLIAHSNPLFGLRIAGGDVAVQIFYIISGFYMSLILGEKYAHNPSGLLLFWKNRLLRIFPAYLAVLAGTIAAYYGLWALTGIALEPVRYWSNHYQQLQIPSLVWLGFSNLFLIGQDALMFLGLGSHSAGQFYLTPRASAMLIPTYQFLFVPQAWTVAVELSFYACAPFLVRRRTAIILLVIGCSLVIRLAILVGLGWNTGKWSYGFFPTELALFLAGALSYRLFRYLRAAPPSWMTLARFIWVTTILLVLAYDRVRSAHTNIILFLVVALSIPLIFLLTKDLRFDKYLGELSYAFYICHFQVIALMRLALPANDPRLSLYSLCLTTGLAALIRQVIERPLEQRRHAALRPAPLLTPAPAEPER